MTTQTVTQALQAIPVSNPAYALAQQILSKLTLAASTTNPTHAANVRRELPGLFQQVVNTLIASGNLPAPTVLAALPLNVADIGATGSYTLGSVATTSVY
jgi:hypothetical protein